MLRDAELAVLSYYRACELAGSILFGRLALHTTIDDVRVQLTHHCLEEAEHAWLWTKTIEELGHVPQRVTHTYQTEYGKRFGLPKDTLEILCLTQVFERRTLQHFQLHRDAPGTHPLIKATLQKMIDDESGHLGWVRTKLDEYEAKEPKRLRALMAQLTTIDEDVYASLATQYPFTALFATKAQQEATHA
ncbi:ferritin-like domain-containing protein [Candidatus Berkelbacteria bacterium]|nr:ferritin-like domain-containing protein [Candidatus Berkelbacteria bacterium]